MKYEEIETIKEELSEYADMEGTEVGEICRLLISVLDYESYVSQAFYESVVKEAREQLENFKENSIIKEEEVVRVQSIKYVEWK